MYTPVMSLYWRDVEIKPGMLLAVDLYRPEVYNSAGRPTGIRWKILSFESRDSDDAYYDYLTGKKYSLKKVIKNKRLQARLSRNQLLQIPACIEFMAVQEFHDGLEAYKRCYNLDMLATVRNIRIIEQS